MIWKPIVRLALLITLAAWVPVSDDCVWGSGAFVADDDPGSSPLLVPAEAPSDAHRGFVHPAFAEAVAPRASLAASTGPPSGDRAPPRA
jgi:hypothetical protein